MNGLWVRRRDLIQEEI